MAEAAATNSRFLFLKQLALGAALGTLCISAWAQAPAGGSVTTPSGPVAIPQPQIDASTYQGSASHQALQPGVLPLSLADAIQRGLRDNLGLLLTSQNIQSARGARLEQLQSLLPTVTGTLKEAVQETDLQAQGLRIPGFPTIIGPYGYTDIRGSLNWSLCSPWALSVATSPMPSTGAGCSS